jgi:hypothetical protein
MDFDYVVKKFSVIDPTTGERLSNVPQVYLECVRVPIPKDLFRVCKQLDDAEVMEYRQKTSRYGRGAYAENGLDGFLGEAAGSLLFGVSADWQHKRLGDGGYDFRLFGRKVDIKTSQNDQWARNLIKREAYGHKEPLLASFYIGSYIEDRREDSCTVVLVGYVHKSVLDKQPLVPSPRPDWRDHVKNTVLSWSSVSPIREFLEYYEQYKKRATETDRGTM